MGKFFEKQTDKAEISYEEVEGYTHEEFRWGDIDELKVFQEITCQIVFDVKMGFTRKARYVANVAMNNTPMCLCYSSILSRDSVRIAFLIATLNDLYILYVPLLTHILMLYYEIKFGLLKGCNVEKVLRENS